jgi:hypothetical protein
MNTGKVPVAQAVRTVVKRLPKGRPFSLRRFDKLGASARGAVEKAIARLVDAGELERVYRGVYMRPKSTRFVGRVRPSAIAVARLVAKDNGHKIQIHGAEAVRRLGLSTQMQVSPIYYTSGPSRVIQIGNSSVRLVHRSATRLQHVGTNVGLALTALFYMGKKTAVDPAVVAAIRKHLTPEELQLLKSSHIPQWMRNAFEDIS